MFSDPSGGVTRWAVLALACALAAGCSLSREVSKSPRTAVEQLLLTQAVDRSLRNLSLPIPDGHTVVLESAALTGDQEFVQKVIADRLNRQGFRLPKNPGEATYRVRVTIEALGTEQGISFVGMPPVQSVLIPFALPELALYKNAHQKAVARMSVDLYDAASGRLISTSPWYEATTFYNQYTVLLFFSFERTDLILPD